MKYFRLYIICAMFFGIGLSCNQKKGASADTPNSGTIKISVDESYQPLIDTEISVFQALNPEAHIIASYKSEAACFKDLINDSARLIVVTRPLDSAESKYFNDIKMPISSKPFARDAVALIVNPSNTDTLMTMSEIRGIMDGKSNPKKYSVVFDQQNSSLVRFVIDSINHGTSLPSYAMVANGCDSVVEYVSQHKNALGVIGVSWVSDPFDSTGLSFLQKIKVVGVMSDSTYNYLNQNPGFNPHNPEYTSYYFKPYQAYIAFRSYPLTRTVYFVLRQPYFGLGTGFANFLGGNKGQMIVGKQRLFPLNLNIQIQKVNIE